ncbi:M48 family metallopeptidase [Sulfurimonas sp.]|uniref:M48 family metallopeptidase n=1 Tax=Sulfurimonas sp. TaxID=2022749 RepID=UPI003D14A86D
MQLQGHWYARDSAKQHSAILHFDENDYTLIVEDEIRHKAPLSSLKLDDRLGNITRKIILEDGSLFTSDAHDEIDRFFHQHKKANRFLHILESKLRYVLLSFVLLIISVYVFIDFGIPYFSKKIAFALPNETNTILTEQSMKILDKLLFKPSKIPLDKQVHIAQHFRKTLLPLLPDKDQYHYHLNFRLLKDGNLSLPNAMALPSGEIVLTDKFVELCENDTEIDAILLHEVGHVIHRDSLQMLVEGTFISVSVMIALGDTSGMADMGAGLGSMLVNLQYSREHETSADNFAFQTMLENNIDPIAFATIMDKMQVYMKENMEQNSTSESAVEEYMSTHPLTQQRIETAKNYSECFRNSSMVSKCFDTSKNP